MAFARPDGSLALGRSHATVLMNRDACVPRAGEARSHRDVIRCSHGRSTDLALPGLAQVHTIVAASVGASSGSRSGEQARPVQLVDHIFASSTRAARQLDRNLLHLGVSSSPSLTHSTAPQPQAVENSNATSKVRRVVCVSVLIMIFNVFCYAVPFAAHVIHSWLTNCDLSTQEPPDGRF